MPLPIRLCNINTCGCVRSNCKRFSVRCREVNEQVNKAYGAWCSYPASPLLARSHPQSRVRDLPVHTLHPRTCFSTWLAIHYSTDMIAEGDVIYGYLWADVYAANTMHLHLYGERAIDINMGMERLPGFTTRQSSKQQNKTKRKNTLHKKRKTKNKTVLYLVTTL